MANIPIVETIKGYGRIVFAVVTVENKVCLWHTYDESGRNLSFGYSRGTGGTGLGGVLLAMKNAKASARRWLTRKNLFKESS